MAPADPLAPWMAGGLLAFALTCLGGHPLLIDEPAFTFWALFGAMAGWGEAAGGWDPAPASERSRWLRRATPWLAAALAVSAVVSIRTRATAAVGSLDLDHVGIGLSLWKDSPEGVRYRLAGAESTVYVPSSARLIVVPLRSARAGAEARVALLLDGKPADVVLVPADQWQYQRLILPRTGKAPRFWRLDLRVAGATPADQGLLMIGKVTSQ